jgi:zinc transporter 5/7
MAAYALPTSSIPQHHHHSSDHIHLHSHSHSHSRLHSHSHSPQPLSSKSPAVRSLRGDPRPNGHSHSRNHAHTHTHSLAAYNEQNMAAFKVNSTAPTPGDRATSMHSIPSSDTGGGLGHWRTDSTLGGKLVISPMQGSFVGASAYEPPELKAPVTLAHDHSHEHSHSHSHNHDHSHAHTTGDWSRATGLLLPYTSRWPLLHTIMTERDSRRIFYFMMYVGIFAPPWIH